MLASTRLPGIQFDVVAPTSLPTLVRMDIAVFVGFAASGPLQIPVAVEDIDHFQEIFGDDCVLANDSGGQPIYACLASSVRAFFRNGGSRCWIIRVAGGGAVSNRFPLPGVVRLQDNGPSKAHALARSEGSWSDNTAVGTALRTRSIEVGHFTGDLHSVGLVLLNSSDVVAGDLLRFNFGDPENPFWLFVDDVTPVTEFSPPLVGRRGLLVIVEGQVVWQANSLPVPSTIPVCERVTMDLFAHNDTGTWSLTDLGFAPKHPRYWASLPVDAQLYATRTLKGLSVEATHPCFPLAEQLYTSDTPQGWLAEAAYPRFPLAGEDATGLYVPIGVGLLPGDFEGPDLLNLPSPLERDGLAVFNSELFLDPSLVDSNTIDLLSEADYIRYQSSRPRALTGIHAALAIEEATIIAVPDAIQRGWVQVSSAGFVSPLDSAPFPHPERFHVLDCSGAATPVRPPQPAGQFEPCNPPIVAAPHLQDPDVSGGSYTLQWTTLQDAVDFLEEAQDPNFATKAVVYQGSSGRYTIYTRPAGDYYYRVKRKIGCASSDYSNGVGLRIPGRTNWLVDPADANQDDTLLSVQSALLRMCAARGDLFAALALPQHYHESEAMAHAAQLKSALEGGEQNAYSFGALYHPWLVGREEDDLLNLRSNPPDGAMAGIMAVRSTQRGPWISPANELLQGVIDLTPSILKSSRQELQDAQINLIRQEPTGFLCLCELTLSDDPDLAPINVRRLLSFLRKTALREGVNYVFEPNSSEFRRSVQRGFETLFDSLLRRGAFAGRTSRDSYQVVVDSSVNTPQSIDGGRLIVELRVAPSLPMRFLTIRLVQSADRTEVTEGQ